MRKLFLYFLQIVCLGLSKKRQQLLVWQTLKEFQTRWSHGVYEDERYILTLLDIGNNKPAQFYYQVDDDGFFSRVKIIDKFSSDLTSDIFILATHFNNILNDGVVIVSAEEQYVEYRVATELLIVLLTKDEINLRIMRHFSTSKVIHSAYRKLLEEGEAPAIIIADLLRSKSE